MKAGRIVFNFPCLPVAAGKDGTRRVPGRTRLRSKKTRVGKGLRPFSSAAARAGRRDSCSAQDQGAVQLVGLPRFGLSRAPDVPRRARLRPCGLSAACANRRRYDRKSFSAMDAVVYVYARDGAGAPPTLPPLASSNGAPSSFYEGALPPARDVVTSRRVCRVVAPRRGAWRVRVRSLCWPRRRGRSGGSGDAVVL